MKRQKRGEEPGWDRKPKTTLEAEGYSLVVFAADLLDEEGDAFCPAHNQDYTDCPCIGPTEDDVEYEICQEGELMGRRLEVRVTYGLKHATPESTKLIAETMRKLPHDRS